MTSKPSDKLNSTLVNIKNFLSVVLTAILIILALMIPFGYGYYSGIFDVFNYPLNLDNVSFFKLHLFGLQAVSVRMFKTLWQTIFELSFYGIITYVVLNIIHNFYKGYKKYKEFLKLKLNQPKIFKKILWWFINFIGMGFVLFFMCVLCIWIFMKALGLGSNLIRYGKELGLCDASRMIQNESYYLRSYLNFNHIPEYRLGTKIQDTNDLAYNGFLIDGTAANGLLYGSTTPNNEPAVYVIENSKVKLFMSYPIPIPNFKQKCS